MLIVTEYKLLPLVLVTLPSITVSPFIFRASWIRVESFCSESVNSSAEVPSILCRFGVEWNRTEKKGIEWNKIKENRKCIS